MKTTFDTLPRQMEMQTMESKMGRPSPAHRSQSLLRCVLLLCVLIATGCDSNGMDEPRVLSGVWTGPITHTNPDLGGSLTLTITQTGEVLTGSAVWRSPGSASTGDLLGDASDSGPITFTLSFGRGSTSFHEATLRDGQLTGTWVSAKSNAIAGTFSLQRQ